MTRESKNTHEYVNGSFVFRWQYSPEKSYDSHIQIFTRRHYDNCLANKTMPWAMEEIKVRAVVKTDRIEYRFIVGTEFAQFVDFCEDWITNPHATHEWARKEIDKAERIRDVQFADNPNLPYRVGDHGDTANLPYPVNGKTEEDEDWNQKMSNHIETIKLSDFPYIVHKEM